MIIYLFCQILIFVTNDYGLMTMDCAKLALMVITYHGGQAFRVSLGDFTLAFNPISKESRLKTGNFGADVVLITTKHADMNGRDQAARGEKEPFVIDGPGEYEIRDVIIKGFQTESTYDNKEYLNTVYYVNLEGMSICFVGALKNPSIGVEASEEIDSVDILFVPIDGEGELNSADAYKLAVGLEAKVVIPMGTHMTDAHIKQFLKEGGAEGVKGVDKLTLKRKDVDGKNGEIMVLDAQ